MAAMTVVREGAAAVSPEARSGLDPWTRAELPVPPNPRSPAYGFACRAYGSPCASIYAAMLIGIMRHSGRACMKVSVIAGITNSF